MVQEPQSSLQRVSKFDWWLWSGDTWVPCVMCNVSNAGLNKKNLFCALIITCKNLLTSPLTEPCVPWQVLSTLANWPEDSFSTQMAIRDVDSGYPPGDDDRQDALSYCPTPNTAWHGWESAVFCMFLHELFAVQGSMWHTHLLLAVPFPQALPCCSYFMTEPSAIQKAGVWQTSHFTDMPAPSYQVLQFALTV